MMIETIRMWQFSKMEKAISTLDYLLKSAPPEMLSTVRDGGTGWTVGGTGWTVLQVMGHLRDFEAIFLERSQLTVNEKNPELPFPDPDTLATTNNYGADDMGEVFDTWKMHREAHLAFLRGLAPEEVLWERPAQHPVRGRFTLHDQLFLTAWHDVNHIEQIAHILRPV